jgi:hypothetical protein
VTAQAQAASNGVAPEVVSSSSSGAPGARVGGSQPVEVLYPRQVSAMAQQPLVKVEQVAKGAVVTHARLSTLCDSSEVQKSVKRSAPRWSAPLIRFTLLNELRPAPANG